MANFPPDKDLSPGDRTVSAILRPDVEDPRDVNKVVDAVRREYGRPCDIVLLAVPAGKGRPFVDGLAETLTHSSGPGSE